jgi:hypothetical protein
LLTSLIGQLIIFCERVPLIRGGKNTIFTVNKTVYSPKISRNQKRKIPMNHYHQQNHTRIELSKMKRFKNVQKNYSNFVHRSFPTGKYTEKEVAFAIETKYIRCLATHKDKFNKRHVRTL